MSDDRRLNLLRVTVKQARLRKAESTITLRVEQNLDISDSLFFSSYKRAILFRTTLFLQVLQQLPTTLLFPQDKTSHPFFFYIKAFHFFYVQAFLCRRVCGAKIIRERYTVFAK